MARNGDLREILQACGSVWTHVTVPPCARHARRRVTQQTCSMVQLHCVCVLMTSASLRCHTP